MIGRMILWLVLVSALLCSGQVWAELKAGTAAPDLHAKPVGQERNVNLRNLKGNSIVLVFCSTTKMVPVAGVGPETCTG